jgi:hypothetical protein
MIYNAHPSYEILQNKLLDFALMQRLRRFAKYWDLVGNSGNFVATTPLLWNPFGVPPLGGHERSIIPNDASEPAEAGTPNPSPFTSLLRFSDWLYVQIGRTDSIALVRLAEKLFQFLTSELKLETKLVAETLWSDWQRGGRRDPPEFLREFLPAEAAVRRRMEKSSLPKRQARHLAA